MQPLGQPAQLLEGPRELILRAGDLFPGPRGRPSAVAQDHRQLFQSPLRPIVHAALQPPAFLISVSRIRRRDASSSTTRACTSAWSRALRPPAGARSRLQQPRVLQHGRVVDQDGDRLALALHHGHRARSRHRAAARPSASMNTPRSDSQ